MRGIQMGWSMRARSVGFIGGAFGQPNKLTGGGGGVCHWAIP